MVRMMKRDLKLLAEALEKKAGTELRELSGFRKLMQRLRLGEKPSAQTLDRLALFMGFQNWTDLHEALKGNADAERNYEDTGHE
jgi:hypothetical protein